MSPINPYFNTTEDTLDQDLIEDLINECVGQFGMNMYYVSKTQTNYDKIYGEDDQSTYVSAWSIAAYVKDVFGYAGTGTMMSKFGVNIDDQIIVSIPGREFNSTVGADSSLIRPQEGDLVFFPSHKRVFQINFVNQLEFFFPLGKLYTYECTCELFQYSGETFNTGIPEIDRIQTIADENILSYALSDENYVPLRTEKLDYLVVDSYNPTVIDPQDDGEALDTKLDDILDFSEDDPFNDYANERI